ncbi:hypothetical protein [Brucella sp. NBRC 12953]|uniref:hypothetical protein n=1 Tax=Brucella sp. NBRC 12953 TaxID=3075481 RepID=UPI00333EDC8F
MMGIIAPTGKIMDGHNSRVGNIPVYAAQPIKSDGGSTSYYELPDGASELNDLIEHKGMSFALGNIFKACYRFGEKDAASRLYDLNKIIFFAERLKALELSAKNRTAIITT